MPFALPCSLGDGKRILLNTATEKTDFLGISSVACLENTIYALTYDALYTLDESGDSTRWKLDTATLIPQGAGDGFFSPLALLIFDGAPHALASRLLYSADRGEIDLYELGLYALRLEEAAQAVEFELTLPLETDDWVSYDNGQANLELPAQRFFSTGDSLYGVPRFLGAGESLLRFSLTDGTLETIATPQGASQILPYREGKLLVQMGNPAMLQDMSLAEWSPDTGDVQTLCSLPAEWEEAPGYLYFHAAENAVYLAYDGELYRMQDMDADNLTVLDSPACAWPKRRPSWLTATLWWWRMRKRSPKSPSIPPPRKGSNSWYAVCGWMTRASPSWRRIRKSTS